jgi:hypothetical protein
MSRYIDDVNGVVVLRCNGRVGEKIPRFDLEYHGQEIVHRTPASHLQRYDAWKLLVVSQERTGFHP